MFFTLTTILKVDLSSSMCRFVSGEFKNLFVGDPLRDDGGVRGVGIIVSFIGELLATAYDSNLAFTRSWISLILPCCMPIRSLAPLITLMVFGVHCGMISNLAEPFVVVFSFFKTVSNWLARGDGGGGASATAPVSREL